MDERYPCMRSFIRAVQAQSLATGKANSGHGHTTASLVLKPPTQSGYVIFRVTDWHEDGRGNDRVTDSSEVRVKADT